MGTSVQNVAETNLGSGLSEVARQLQEAANARKCWACGCLRHALDAIDRTVPGPSRPEDLTAAVAATRAHLAPQRYECLGCEVCYPAIALNALGPADGSDAAACPTEPVEARAGWPRCPVRIACCAIMRLLPYAR